MGLYCSCARRLSSMSETEPMRGFRWYRLSSLGANERRAWSVFGVMCAEYPRPVRPWERPRRRAFLSWRGRGAVVPNIPSKPCVSRFPRYPAGMSDTPRDVRDLGEVVVVPLSSIKPHPRNPRRIPERAVEAVALSLQRFGWQQPLVVDGDMVLVAGHTRVKAAQSLGLTKVPVIVARDLTPDEIDAFRIADNRTHDFTSWDFPELVSQL